MKNKPQRLANSATAAVLSLHGQQAGQIEPPEGWTLQTPFGHQAFSQGDDGRLVRLAELVRFLEVRRGLPRVAAVHALCELMPEDVMGWLYRLQAGNFAQAVDAGGTIKGKFRISAAHLSRTHGQVADAPPPAPGRESLLAAILKEWGSESTRGRGRDDPLDDVRDPLNALAVPHGKAREVWGWGTMKASPLVADLEPSDWASLVPYRKAHAGAEWDVQQLEIARAEWVRRGGKVKDRNAMAAELGVSRQSFAKTISMERKRGSKQPGAAVTTRVAAPRKRA